MESRIKRLVTVESVTYLVTAALACGLGVVFLSPHAPALRAQRVARGMNLRPPNGYAWGSHERTLVLGLRGRCPYCRDSMPFYERLFALERSHNTNTHLLAVWPDAPAAVGHSLPPGLQGMQVLSSVDLGTLGIVGTPTVILVDRSGRVENAWLGILPPSGEDDVVRAIQAASSAPQLKEPCGDAKGCFDTSLPGFR